MTLRNVNLSTTQKVLLSNTSDSFATGRELAGPYTANAHGNGYYRVQYAPEQLKSLAAFARALDVPERLGLLSDQWALCFAGHTPISSYLDLTKSYVDETDPNVVSILVENFRTLYRYCDSSMKPKFERLVRQRFAKQEKLLGWKHKNCESDLSALSRRDVLVALGTFGQDRLVIAHARAIFSQYLSSLNKLNLTFLRQSLRSLRITAV